MIPVSTFIVPPRNPPADQPGDASARTPNHARSCHWVVVSSLRGVERGRTPKRGYKLERDGRTHARRPAAPLAELHGYLHQLSAGVPVLLPRAAARVADAAGLQGHARAPRAAAPAVAATGGTHVRRRTRGSPTRPRRAGGLRRIPRA